MFWRCVTVRVKLRPAFTSIDIVQLAIHSYSYICPNSQYFADDLGRAVEELVTVITEQEIETTIEPEASHQPINVDANDTSVGEASNSDSRPLNK